MSIEQRTRNAIATMMKQDTGSHPMDSGDAYGRRFEQLATVELDATPKTYIENGTCYKSMYHHLSGTLMIDDTGNAEFAEYVAKEAKPNKPWRATILDYIYEYGYSIISEGLTYNYENVLDGDFQWYYVDTHGNNAFGEIMIIQTHNGCDIRGGYSTPVLFGIDDISDVLDINDVAMQCTADNMHVVENSRGQWTEQHTSEIVPVIEKDGLLYCPTCNAPYKAC